MAFIDWDHNGKYDDFDRYMDYQMLNDGIKKGSGGGGGSHRGGGMSTLAAILCVFGGLVVEAIIFAVFKIDVDDVSVIVLIMLWMLFTCILAAIYYYIKK